MTPDLVPSRASIGSVFLRSSNRDRSAVVLGVLFGDGAVTERTGGWLEVAGDVDVFVEPVLPEAVPDSAGFGFKVADAGGTADAFRRVSGLTVGDLFEVAPSVAGFNCRGDGLPELFVHE